MLQFHNQILFINLIGGLIMINKKFKLICASLAAIFLLTFTAMFIKHKKTDENTTKPKTEEQKEDKKQEENNTDKKDNKKKKK